jgi:probable rRNA maturation factor
VKPAIEVVDETGLVRAEGPVADLVAAVLGAEGAPGAVAVAFVGEQVIAELSRRYRSLEEPTDVLSFRYAGDDVSWPDRSRPEPGGEESSPGDDTIPDLGEVIVCPEVVRRYAQEEGGDPGRQLGWTLIHGVLHLLGYDHERDGGEMRLREQELLEELDRLVSVVSLADND